MSRGGSRYGAGRPATRPRIEDCAVLDVRRLRAKGALRPGDHGAIDVGHGPRLWYRTMGDLVVLRRAPEGCVFQTVRIDSTRANLGVGQRWWLCCPREDCGRRCMRLYWPPRSANGFACGRCARVTYPSQRLSQFDMAKRRCDDLQAQLCQARMQDKTYLRLRRALVEAEQARAAAFKTWAMVRLRLPA